MKILNGLMSNKLIVLSLATAIPLIMLASLLVMGSINPRYFAMGCAATMIFSAIAWFIALRHYSRGGDHYDTPTSPNALISTRSKYIRVAGLLAWLVVAFWLTKGGPWGPRLIGALFLGLLLFGTLARKTK
jgi:hypothetical protein